MIWNDEEIQMVRDSRQCGKEHGWDSAGASISGLIQGTGKLDVWISISQGTCLPRWNGEHLPCCLYSCLYGLQVGHCSSLSQRLLKE